MTRPAVETRRIGWVYDGFARYCVRYMRRHFHAVRLAKGSAPLPPDGPILAAANHPGWWDAVLCPVLGREFGDRRHFAAIDAAMLKQYPIFDRLGFFGVNTASLSGAAEFLRTGSALLSNPKHVVWVTAQGEFADVRKRPLELRSGVGHLAARMSAGWVLPVAVEYAFWNERTPECLVRFGVPLRVADDPGLSGKEWTRRIEPALTDTLDVLNRETMTRDPGLFRPLVDGRTGVGGVYDTFRRLRAWATGRRFDPGHDDHRKAARGV